MPLLARLAGKGTNDSLAARCHLPAQRGRKSPATVVRQRVPDSRDAILHDQSSFAIVRTAGWSYIIPGQAAGNHLSLNFRSALENVEDARIAKDATDLVFKGITIAAVDLQCSVGV